MTIIVLNTDDKSVVLAADRLWMTDDYLKTFAPKLIPIVRGTKTIGMIGTAGFARKGFKFEEAILETFKNNSPTANPLDVLNEAVDVWGRKSCPEAIVVVRGIGYIVDTDGFVNVQLRGAIGSGAQIAMGAMWNRSGSALRLAKLGCQAACELTVSCGGEIDVFEMPLHTP